MAAYASAYAKADQADELNRALVYNYIATGSKAVAGEIRMTLQDPELATEAESYARAAVEKDHVRAGFKWGKFFWKLLPGGAVAALALAAGSFLIALGVQANEFGEHAGAGLAGVAVSGSALYFLSRGLLVAAQNATAVGDGLSELIGSAFASNAEAKSIIRGLGNPERGLLGGGHALKRAQKGRLVVDLTGPAAGVALSIAIAIPLVILAVGLAGAVVGYQDAVSDPGYPGEITLPESSTFPE